MLILAILSTSLVAFWPLETHQSLFSQSFPFSWHNINYFLGLSNTFISYIISFPIVIATHFVLLLGFRENIFLEGFLYPESFFDYLQLLMSCFLFFLHSVGFFTIICSKTFSKKRIIIVYAYCISSLILVSHIRYFMPLIPITLLGVAFLIEMLINRKKMKYNNLSL